jgi:PAS domain S-box-containing protein
MNDPEPRPATEACQDAPWPQLAWGDWLDAHPLAHFVYDPQSLRMLAANEAALQRYGYSREEFLGLTRADLLLPSEVPALHDFLAGLPGSARTVPQRVWLERTRSGHVLHADVRGMQVLVHGRVARLAAVVDAGARAVLAQRAGQADNLLAVAGRMAHLGGWTLDLAAGRVHWSDEVCALHEVPPGTECEVNAAIAYYPGGAAQALRASLQRCMDEGTPMDLELPLVGARGTQRWVRVVGAAVRDEQGRIVRIHGAQQDITARKQDAMALQESRARMAALLAALPDLWLVLDADGRFAEVSDPEHPSLLAPWADVHGRHYQDVLPPALADRVPSLLASAHATGRAQGHQYTLLVRGGAHRRFEVRCVALPAGRSMAVIRDLTETVQLEQRFHAMAQTAPIGIFTAGVAGDCTYTNPAWQALFDLHGEHSLGRAWVRRVHADDLARVLGQLKALARTAPAMEMEFRLVLPDGQVRYVAAHASPERGPDGRITGFVGAATDITQARELQAERQAHAVAQEAGRQQAVFMSRMSHELRTPLNAILGFGELLQQDGAVPDTRARAYVDYVVQAGRHMLALVDDLLELQRLNDGRVTVKPIWLDVAALLRDCADLLGPLADGAGVALSVATAPDCKAECDERCLRQVVLNLGSNAVKYAGRGARVVMDATLADGPVAGRTYLVVTVQDSGVGMTAAQLQRLFQPFDRLGQEAGKQPGSGLGLVITQQLAHIMGGSVHISSAPGQGTTATVVLPASPAKA